MIHSREIHLPEPFMLLGEQRLPGQFHFLHAGPLEIAYLDGNLRYFSSGGKEILRMIYPAVRDRDWNTVIPQILSEEIRSSEEDFSIALNALYKGFGINFLAEFVFAGTKEGTVSCTMVGKAQNTFLKNRIGFCILHPIVPCSGQKVIIFHPDGSTENTSFPVLISPHQPFINIAAMEYEVENVGWFRIEFEGDIFETEDQRNWTDDSYKTYSTPLADPFPVEVKEGTVIRQAIRFSVKTRYGSVRHATKQIRPVDIAITDKISIFPAIGIMHSPENPDPADSEIELLRLLCPDHLRVDLALYQPGWENHFAMASKTARKLQIPVFLSLEFSEKYMDEAQRFVEECYADFPSIEDILLINKQNRVTTHDLYNKVSVFLRDSLAHIRIGVGTNAYFAEFNRSKPFSADADFLSWSVNPQVHAFDWLTLMENMRAQADTVFTAHAKYPGIPIYVSPVTLRPRFNPNATSGVEVSSIASDPRQVSLLAAGWMTGSLKYLAEEGVAKITYFETIGDKGFFIGSSSCSAFLEFQQAQNVLFPVFFVLKELQKYRRSNVLKTIVSEPLKVSAICLQCGEFNTLVLVNHSLEPTEVNLPFINNDFQIRVFDQLFYRRNARFSGEIPELPFHLCRLKRGILHLQPLSVAFLDFHA